MSRGQLKSLLLFMLCFGILVSGSAFGQGSYGGVLVITQPQEALELDPGLMQDNDSAQVAVNIFDSLLKFQPATERIEPGLAVSWDSFEGGKIWVFRLRKGVRFQDGSLFDAQAVKFNLERQAFPVYSPYSPSQRVFSFWGALFNGFPGWLKTVDLLDDYTVKVELERPLVFFPRVLALPEFGLISPKAAREFGNKVYLNPVGTGPFKLVEWRKGQRIVLESYSRHWEGRPFLDRVIFQAAPVGEARMRQLLRGQADLILELRGEDIPDLKDRSRIKIARMPQPNLVFLAFNFRKKPLNSIRFRQALNYAVNKKRIVQEFCLNRAVPAVSLLPYASLGFNPQISGYEYNPSKSQALLYWTGVRRGLKLELILPKQDMNGLQEAWRLARILAQDLNEVGIELKLVVLNKEEYFERLRTADYDLALTSLFAIRSLPDAQLYLLLGRQGESRGRAGVYGSPRLEELFSAAWKNSAPAYRNKVYQEMVKLVYEKAALVPLYFNYSYYAHNSSLRGIQISPFNLLEFKNTYFEAQ